MKILIIGFQRSGTTLLRRLVHLHPEVRRMFHEAFLLNKCKTQSSINDFVSRHGINLKKHNWGEKVPYYPNVRKHPTIKYCQKWQEYFNAQSRIIHIIRHPYDIVFSTINKFKNVNNFNGPMKIYKRIIHRSVPEIYNMKNTFTIKYEDLLMNPDEVVYNIYKFCNLKPDIDYKKLMLKIKNPKYQKIDASRAFAYKDKEVAKKYEIGHILENINDLVGGVPYEE